MRRHVSPLGVGIGVLVGAAALAVWVDVRLGDRTPGSILKVLVHCILASIAVRVGAGLATQLLAGESRAQIVLVLCLIVLPGWIYAFLVSLWTLKLVRSALPR
jgi:hypothetical protein